MIRITLEFATMAAASEALHLLQDRDVQVADSAVRAALQPRVVAAEAKPSAKALEAVAVQDVKTAKEPTETTAKQVTDAVVSAVARVGKESVIALLRDRFNVAAGKEITDPATRAEAVAALTALVK